MRALFNRISAWLIDQALFVFVSFLTGIRSQPEGSVPFAPEKKVYFANHGSHGDFVMVWISLPKQWRRRARPVAGADYWLNSRFRSFIINQVFNGLLIPRNSGNPKAATEQMGQALQQGDSLIIFPEGTRNTNDDVILLPFKSGIYHLARENPDTAFVPIWIDNIRHVLPKGKIIPVPLICQVNIGSEIRIQPGEDKEAFLQRSRAALLALAPEHKRPQAAQAA